MSEYVYQLDLPPLDEILTESGRAELLVGQDKPIYRQYHPKGLVKPEWLTWAGIEWDFVNFFYKNNHVGVIHIDGPGVWGINWIHGGYGVMEYWLPEDVIESEPEYDMIGSRRTVCTAVKDPIKVYKTLPGAYLTDASIPHRPSGYDGRYAFSLRCYSNTVTWADAVVKFQHVFK
jgi:hypothetical protein